MIETHRLWGTDCNLFWLFLFLSFFLSFSFSLNPLPSKYPKHSTSSLFLNCCTEQPVACMSNMLNTPLFLFDCTRPAPPPPPSLSVSCAAAVIAASKANVFIETKGVCHWFATHTHTHMQACKGSRTLAWPTANRQSPPHRPQQDLNPSVHRCGPATRRGKTPKIWRRERQRETDKHIQVTPIDPSPCLHPWRAYDLFEIKLDSSPTIFIHSSVVTVSLRVTALTERRRGGREGADRGVKGRQRIRGFNFPSGGHTVWSKNFTSTVPCSTQRPPLFTHYAVVVSA